MKTTTMIGATLALGLAAGCASVKYSSPDALRGVTVAGAAGPVSRLVTVDTTGYYLLWTIPLASGDLRWDEKAGAVRCGTLLFRDLVGLDELQTALVKIAESQDCDLVDVSLSDSDTSYAGPSYGGLVGTLFGSSRLSASAVLVPRAITKGGQK